MKSNGYVVKYSPKGLKNSELASLALGKGYILVTSAKASPTRYYPPKQFHGTIILRIHPPKAPKIIKEMKSLLTKVKDYEGKLFIIKEGALEIVEDKS